VLACLLLVPWSIGRAQEEPDLHAVAAGMKAKMKLPVAIDADTRLDDIQALSKHELAYFMTHVRQTKAQLNAAAFAKEMDRSLKAGACQNPNYVKFFRAGVTLMLVYATQDRAEVARIRLTPSLCKS
jgi:hypothetical protein